QISMFKGERDKAVQQTNEAAAKLQVEERRRLDVEATLETVAQEKVSLDTQGAARQQTIEQLNSEIQDLVAARKEADRRRDEAEDAMRSAQDRSTVESQTLVDRIASLEEALEKAIDAQQLAEAIADKERRAASDARLAAEPRIAAWKAAQTEADDLEIEDD
ncbi:MAG: hypothetical protein ACPGTU_08365, partial [Myxococcota bacterium]